MSEAPARRRPLLRKVAFAVLPWVALVLLAEVGLRIAGAGAAEVAPPSTRIEDYVREELTAPDGRRSSYRRGTYVGQEVVLNENGYRDWLYHEKDVEDAVRVAAVGDSFTFGDGLAVDDTWLRRLGASLAPHVPGGRPLRTLNFGRRGANTADALRALEGRVLRFEPDLVVLGFTLFNDAETKRTRVETKEAHERRAEETTWRLAHVLRDNSSLVRFVSRRLRRARNREAMQKHIEAQYADDAEGWIECRTSLGAIAAACRNAGVPLIVVVFPAHHKDAALNDWDDYPFAEQHRKVAAALGGGAGVAVVDVVKSFGDFQGRVIWIPGNGHPDPVYARRVAEQLLPEARRLLGF